MRKLLVPVDGSENAMRALDYAASLAAAGLPVAIHLLHIYESIPDGERTHAFHSVEELERPQREKGEAVLREAERRAALSGATVVPELVGGEVAETILSRAEALGCHSIIMGMKGHSLLTELVVGSTTMEVLRATPLPVTLVK